MGMCSHFLPPSANSHIHWRTVRCQVNPHVIHNSSTMDHRATGTSHTFLLFIHFSRVKITRSNSTRSCKTPSAAKITADVIQCLNRVYRGCRACLRARGLRLLGSSSTLSLHI